MLDLRKMMRDAIAELDRETELEERRAARAFLKELDPNSQEGMWFEALAEKFPSRLEAAVAYLRDVKR
jgi:hypothetical protein